MDRAKDRVAIITGAGGYLGAAMARTLANEGADVAIWELGTVMEDAEKAAEEIRDIGRKAVTMAVDVTNSSQVNEAAQKVISDFGKVDILVNNAGIAKSAPLITDLTDEDWERETKVDLTGVFYCTRAILKHMIDRHYGKIVNIASLAGELGRPITSAAYSSSKAGVLGFTMSVAMSVAKYAICVNAVCPGIILGPIHHRVYTEEQIPKLLEGIPLVEGGRSGVAQDVANAVLFLASSESDYITGTRIRVNGGSLMG